MNESRTLIITAVAEDEGKRLDCFVSRHAGITRARAQKLIRMGNVSVDGRAARKNHRIGPGEKVTVELIEERTDELVAQDVRIDIVYLDNHLVVIDKPAGLVMYPAAGHAMGTLMNAVAFHCPHLASVGAPLRPGVVHRLDRDTSGLVVVALADEAYYSLQRQFRERTIERRYVALVHGTLPSAEGSIDAPIGRAVSDRKKMSTRTRSGKEALTHYRVLAEFGTASLVEARLATGRTHQIRVHFAAIGHPVLGDRTYGRKTVLRIGNQTIPLPRQMLHARTLGFVHPATGERMTFDSPLPPDIQDLKERLESTG